MSQPDFWDDQVKARLILQEATDIRTRLEPLQLLTRRLEDLAVLEEIAAEEATLSATEEVKRETVAIAEQLLQIEIRLLLSQPNDERDAICTLSAGAGGTESCDWAAMLLRMYTRWAERSGYKTEIIDILPGEQAGIKTVTFAVRGRYAYGKLKCERGVHRLVRISPFDANARRHTSFVALDVIAEVDDEIQIEIPEKDIRIDVFRASGHGGQGVNTTDSAVRITHLPTGIIVTCQNERSQLKNRATAMKILKSRLYDLELDKRRAEQEKAYSEKGEIGWGRQIRSYVLHPYQMVKDLRTGHATSDTQAVLDGEIDAFIQAKLRGKKRTDSDNQDASDSSEY